MKVAVAGLGVIGAVHLKILRDFGCDIAGVCDIDENKLGAYPKYAHYADYNRMLKDLRPDAVHICTPHYLRAEKNSSAILGVVHQNRYNPANAYVKEYLKDKKVACGTGFVAWHRDKAYYAQAEWRGKQKTEGGGVLINQALHTLDLLQWFVGFPEYAAVALGNLSLKNAIEVEDTASAVYSGGANFTFFATNASTLDFDVEVTLKTDSETIKILPDCAIIGGELIKFDSRLRVYAKNCYGTGHENLIADFYDCVKHGKKFEIDGAEGAKVVKLILAAYKSKGERVKV